MSNDSYKSSTEKRHIQHKNHHDAYGDQAERGGTQIVISIVNANAYHEQHAKKDYEHAHFTPCGI